MSTLGRDRLKRLARLSEAKVRRAEGLQLLEGRRLVEEALAAGRVSELFVRDQAAARRYMQADVPVHCLGPADMDRLADVRTPQDVIAIGPTYEWTAVDVLLPAHDRVLLLDGVQDPGNVGTLIRTGAALGIEAILVTGPTADLGSPKALRSSAGALFRVRIGRVEEPLELLGAEPTGAHTLVLPVVTGGLDLRELETPDRFVLVAGNEGSGTSMPRDHGSVLPVTIPMSAGVESLNVAAACAVILGRWL